MVFLWHNQRVDGLVISLHGDSTPNQLTPADPEIFGATTCGEGMVESIAG